MSELQFIITTDATGEWDISAQVEDYRLQTRTPGGFWEATLTLTLAARDAWRLYEAWPGGTLTVRAMGMLIWRGDLHGTAFDGENITVTARGAVFRLGNTELWRVYADADYADWTPVDSELFTRDNNNRVYVAANPKTVYDLGAEGVVTYPQTGTVLGEDIVAVTAQAHARISSGRWVLELRDADEAVLWTSAEIAGPQTSELTWDIDVTAATAGLTFALRAAATTEIAERIEAALAGAGGGALSNGVYRYGVALVQGTVEMPLGDTTQVTIADASADGQVDLTLPLGGEAVTARRVYRTEADGDEYKFLTEIADNTTENYQDNSADSALGDTLVIEIWAKLLQVIVRTLDPTVSETIVTELCADAAVEIRDIGTPGLTIDRLRSQGESPLEMVEQLAELGDGSQPWIFTVYEYGAEFREWAYAAEDLLTGWLLTADEVDGWGLGNDVLDVRNAVRAKLPDGTFTAWQEDADSIARYGRREKTLDVPQTSTAEATRWAQIYLYEAASPLAEVQTTVGALVRARDGTAWPAYRVRAGDIVIIRDLIPGQEITVRVREAEYSRGKLRITPVGAANALERLLAARDLRAVQSVVAGGVSGEGLTWAVVSATEPAETFSGQSWVDIS